MIKDFSAFMCFFLPIIQGQGNFNCGRLVNYCLEIPALFQISGNLMTVNGSSETGNCTDLRGNVCHDPTSTVLFDGIIPTLTGLLDGNMWASQLLTTHSNFEIVLSFSGIPGFVGVSRVEIVLFNCPEWGISVQSITLRGHAGITNPNITSCDSLERVCLGNFRTTPAQRELTIKFATISPTDWVHVAEVAFYGADPTCPDDTVITTPTTDEFTTIATVTETSITTVSNAGATAGGVIVAILSIIMVTAVVISIIFCFKRPKGRETFTNLFMHGIRTKTTKKMETCVYDEIDEPKRCKPPQYPVQKSKPSQHGVEQMATTVVEKPKRRKPSQPVQQEVDPPKPCSPQQQNFQMYAVVDKSKRIKQEEYTTVDINSPECTYTQ